MLRLSQTRCGLYVDKLRYLSRFNRRKNDDRVWTRAMKNSEGVAAAYTIDADEYSQWFKDTYGVECSDPSAVSAIPSNTIMDDSKSMARTDLYRPDIVSSTANDSLETFKPYSLTRRGYHR